MQKYNLEQLSDLLSARLAHGMFVECEGNICADSRRVQEGDWFLAICGKDFDGHDFLGDAYSAGACGAIVEERLQYSIGNKTFPLLAVDNTFHALAILARRQKTIFALPVVAIAVTSEQENHAEINRLFDFAVELLYQRGLGAKIYTQSSASECLDLFLNTAQDEVFLFNHNAGSDLKDPDFNRDWNLMLDTLSPEILIECKNTFAPEQKPDIDFSSNRGSYRIMTCSQNINVTKEIEILASKWKLNPDYAGAVIQAFDQEFAKA